MEILVILFAYFRKSLLLVGEKKRISLKLAVFCVLILFV